MNSKQRKQARRQLQQKGETMNAQAPAAPVVVETVEEKWTEVEQEHIDSMRDDIAKLQFALDNFIQFSIKAHKLDPSKRWTLTPTGFARADESAPPVPNADATGNGADGAAQTPAATKQPSSLSAQEKSRAKQERRNEKRRAEKAAKTSTPALPETPTAETAQPTAQE